MATATVRPAVDDDVDALVNIQARTWRAAYTGLVPDAALDELTGNEARAAWTDAVHAGDGFHVLVAVEGEHTVGFCAAAYYAGTHGASIAEVAALLVEPRWGRRGHGSRLLAASVDLWREDGFGTAVAWVYDGDPAIRKFLGSAGWEPDGATRALDVDDQLIPQHRLHTALHP